MSFKSKNKKKTFSQNILPCKKQTGKVAKYTFFPNIFCNLKTLWGVFKNALKVDPCQLLGIPKDCSLWPKTFNFES